MPTRALDLRTGLAVLVLAPEVYLPLRQVGAQFHASADGVAAAEQAFRVLEEPAPETGTAPPITARSRSITRSVTCPSTNKSVRRKFARSSSVDRVFA